MRVAFLVYGALYVVVEIVAHQLAQVSWPELTALDVATALANALLTVAVLVAVLVAADVLGHRWRRAMAAAAREKARLATQAWAEPEPISVPSWRSEPRALPAAPDPLLGAPTSAARADRPADLPADLPADTAPAGNAYARAAWPAEDSSGRLL